PQRAVPRTVLHLDRIGRGAPPATAQGDGRRRLRLLGCRLPSLRLHLPWSRSSPRWPTACAGARRSGSWGWVDDASCSFLPIYMGRKALLPPDFARDEEVIAVDLMHEVDAVPAQHPGDQSQGLGDQFLCRAPDLDLQHAAVLAEQADHSLEGGELVALDVHLH